MKEINLKFKKLLVAYTGKIIQEKDEELRKKGQLVKEKEEEIKEKKNEIMEKQEDIKKMKKC